jgi:hypothetical protein
MSLMIIIELENDKSIEYQRIRRSDQLKQEIIIMRPMSLLQLILILSLSAGLVASNDEDGTPNQECTNDTLDDGADESSCPSPSAVTTKVRVPDSCRTVLAPVATDNWRVFSLVDGKQGTPVVLFGDVVIQLSDPDVNVAATHLSKFVWPGQETGGQYEGYRQVDSLVPGIGMLARSSDKRNANLLPFVPRIDEGGLTRQQSPGAGAITHYHNYTLFYSKEVHAGDELLLSSSLRRQPPENISSAEEKGEISTPTIFELLQSGYCLDNLRPKKSKIKHTGRGAFTTRQLEEGMIVAPVPVLPISRASLQTKSSDGTSSHQLLLNYCFGHINSSTLLYPYGPWVNLVNHYTEPNVKLQWPNGQIPSTTVENIDEGFSFMMELVAIKDIQAGEEIYMDYGRSWEEAWFQHVQQWKPDEEQYSPAYVIDDTIRLLRTEAEQKDHPYPQNVETSCFYRYSDRTDEEKDRKENSANDKVMSFKWKATKGLFDLKNLRPCNVLKRKEDAKGRSVYAVRMFNRPGLDETELIPKGEMHLVTHVPRNAVRFTDKPGSTDQHLPGAFRHEINLKNDVFPEAWID